MSIKHLEQSMNDLAYRIIAGAPSPVAPFSHAVETGDWVFLTGQIPQDPTNDAASFPVDIAAQTRQTMENLKTVLKGLDLGLGNVVAVRVFLTDFYRDYAEMNAIYESYFPKDQRPARTCIGVTGLAREALVEIDLIARRT
ncbi:RidA family protein [Aquisalimonas sp. 2447]|uniref:RidA family protein n=1 Tax=Aquisalimonas sp. 2447 TaxID=2740807 RepID=UPI001C2BFAC2|nr:RidA family protein [Aquisalimonas sp. 2447]